MKIKFNDNITNKIANKEGIILNKNHWIIINFLRNFYIKYEISPNINLLIKFLKNKYKNNLYNINNLNLLFNKKFNNIIYKLSNIPNPKKCIL